MAHLSLDCPGSLTLYTIIVIKITELLTINENECNKWRLKWNDGNGSQCRQKLLEDYETLSIVVYAIITVMI